MSANSRIGFDLRIVFVCLYITPSYCHNFANLWNACHIYFVECVSKIEYTLSVIHYTLYGAVCFHFAHFTCDDWGNINTLPYYHHIGRMKYYPLFRVRPWNNGMGCMSFYMSLWIHLSTHKFGVAHSTIIGRGRYISLKTTPHRPNRVALLRSDYLHLNNSCLELYYAFTGNSNYTKLYINLWSEVSLLYTWTSYQIRKLRVVHALGMPGTSSPQPTPWKLLVSDPDMHHGACVRTCRDACRIANPRWRGKRSRHSRRMRNPQSYVHDKRLMGCDKSTWDC